MATLKEFEAICQLNIQTDHILHYPHEKNIPKYKIWSLDWINLAISTIIKKQDLGDQEINLKDRTMLYATYGQPVQLEYFITSVNLCWLSKYIHWAFQIGWVMKQYQTPFIFPRGWIFNLWWNNQSNHQTALRQCNKGSLGTISGLHLLTKHISQQSKDSISKLPKGHKIISRTESNPAASKYNYCSIPN
jgi:hypothetical protein